MNKAFLGSALLLLCAFGSGLVFADSPVIDINDYKSGLNSVIGSFVSNVVNGTGGGLANNLKQFSKALVGAGAFIGFVFAIMKWTVNKDIVSAGVEVLLITLFLSIYVVYDSFTSVFWGFSDDLAAGVLSAATGTTDSSFIFNQLSQTLSNIFVKDSSWGISMSFWWGVFFGALAFFLEAVLFIISLWTIWGYAFCKLLGLFFFALWFVPVTRPYFSKWVELFLSFWIFNLFSQVAMSIYYLYFKSTIGVFNEPVEYSVVENLPEVQLLSIHMVVGIVFIIAAGKMSAAIASGTDGVSTSASRAAKGLGSAALKFLKKS